MNPDQDPIGQQPDEEALRALLPWAASGKLSGEDRAKVQAWLERSPQARAELAWWQAVERDTRAHTAQQIADHEGDFGLARFQQALAAQPRRTTPDTPAWSARWARWWREHWTTPALATCLLVIVGQMVMLQRPTEAPTALEVLSGQGSIAANELLVAFEPGAREADIRALLQSIQADIVSGPSALGLYRIQFKVPTEQARQQLLQARGVVADVSAVE